MISKTFSERVVLFFSGLAALVSWCAALLMITQAMALQPQAFVSQWKAAGGGAFSPLNTPGCYLWLDGADTSTMYDSVSGGGLVADSGTIGRWEDKSEYTNHTYSTVEASRPKRDDSSMANPSIIYDATDILNWLPSNDGALTNTVFIVTKFSGTATKFVFLYGTSAQYFLASQSGSPSTAINVGSGTNITYRLNGASAGWSTRNDVHVSIGSSLALVTISGGDNDAWSSAVWSIGGYPSGFGIDGNIGEILYYDRQLDQSEINEIESYLMTKWGL